MMKTVETSTLTLAF